MVAMLANTEDVVLVLITIVSKAIFGVICAIIAQSRGRNATGWFFIGFALDCIGMILVLSLPDLKIEEERDRRRTLEQRKLREQIAKERQVADSRHSNIERRLNVHDEALGLDTSTPPALPTAGPMPQISNETQWFYARDNERQGPVSTKTLQHLLLTSAIDDDTLVWSEGMPDWMPVGRMQPFSGEQE
ncbi:MAG: hypothetical protein CMJ88_14535 [Planctomycetes bacterium]|nr:hypothetical protein [Planctomycetota bacterium]